MLLHLILAGQVTALSLWLIVKLHRSVIYSEHNGFLSSSWALGKSSFASVWVFAHPLFSAESSTPPLTTLPAAQIQLRNGFMAFHSCFYFRDGGLREAHCWAPRWGSHELEKIFESMLGTTTLHLMLSKHICSQVHYTCMAYSGLQLPSTYIYIILERKKNVFYSCWKLFRCLSKAKANKQRYFHHHVAH